MRRRFLALFFGFAMLLAVSREAKAEDSALSAVLGAVSNTYGTFQAAQFVASLFGIGTSLQLSDAVSELETFMQTYRDQALVANVNADLQLFQFISANYQSGLTDDLESNFITQCIDDLSNLQTDIQNGTTADAYMLAPAYNLLTVTFVGAVEAFGIINPANAYPPATLNAYLSSAFNTNYSVVGSFFVNYDVFTFGGYSSMLFTQGGKKMWPQYATNYYRSAWTNVTMFVAARWTSENGYYYCDLTTSANADDDLLSSCYYTYSHPDLGTVYVGTLPAPFLSGGQNQLNSSHQNFNADPSVQVVQASIQGLMNQGYSQVTDWNNGVYGIPAIGHIVIE